MVAGVAHEINNPLAFVSNNVAVLQRDVGAARASCWSCTSEADAALAERPARAARGRIHELSRADRPGLHAGRTSQDLLARSRDGLQRIQQIVKDLRDFARLDEGDLNEVDLNAGVESTVNIIRGRADGASGSRSSSTSAPLPPVTCYPAKINQVVMNLLANADRRLQPRRARSRSAPPPADGGGVRIEVADTGRGHRPGDPRPDLRPVLHHQAARAGDGPGPEHQLRDRPGPRRHDRGRVRARPRDPVHRPPPPRRRLRG